MDEDQSDGVLPWWTNTIDFVVKAAAAKRFSSPQLQSGQSYYVDDNGQVLAMGQQVPVLQNANAAAMLNSPMVMLAGLALVGVLLYKLVK